MAWVTGDQIVATLDISSKGQYWFRSRKYGKDTFCNIILVYQIYQSFKYVIVIYFCTCNGVYM